MIHNIGCINTSTEELILYACHLWLALNLKHFVIASFCSLSHSQQQNKSLQNLKIDFDNISENPKSFFFWKIASALWKVTEAKLLCCVVQTSCTNHYLKPTQHSNFESVTFSNFWNFSYLTELAQNCFPKIKTFWWTHKNPWIKQFCAPYVQLI